MWTYVLQRLLLMIPTLFGILLITFVVIQFVPTEKRGSLTIERRSGGNTSPDRPPRLALNGEWGLAMHAQSEAAGEKSSPIWTPAGAGGPT